MMKKEFVFAMFVMLTSFVQVSAQFCIGGIEPFYDNTTNTFLLSVSEQLWGKEWTTEVGIKADASWRNLLIDGEPADGTYTFSEIGGDKKYDLEVMDGEGKKHYQIQFTYLPVLKFVEGNFGMAYKEDECIMQYGNEMNAPQRVKVKWRGGTTNAEGKHKRNYKMKLIDENGDKQEASFFGLRKDNSWILDAGQVDMFRMRNLIASQIWQDFATKPYYIEQEPKALSATRGQMIEMFLGNRYQGIYNLCEPIDRKQMRLKKYDADGVIHGGLWKATAYGDALFGTIPDEYDNTNEKNNVWELKYPEIDDLCPSDYSTLWNAIMFVASSSDTDFCFEVSDYFDIPVLIDYYLFVQITNGFDICGKNIYWAVYDKQVDKKLTPAMWDLDCTMGQNFTDDPLRPDYVAYDYPLRDPNMIFYRLWQLDVNQFQDAVKRRYEQLREDVFSTESLQSRYIDVYNSLADCGAAQREEQRWSYDTDISGLRLDLKDELDYICGWISSRMQFLDQQFSYSPSAITTSEVETGQGKTGVYTLQGLRAPAGYKGVLVHDGKLKIRR